MQAQRHSAGDDLLAVLFCRGQPDVLFGTAQSALKGAPVVAAFSRKTALLDQLQGRQVGRFRKANRYIIHLSVVGTSNQDGFCITPICGRQWGR